jgi:eukaryotic translation initiation factor 2C
MEPNQKYPFNVRSFYPETGKRAIGSGIKLWQGFFQSVRLTMGRMIINIDISTATMYKSGSLIDLCLQFLGRTNVNALAPRSGSSVIISYW